MTIRIALITMLAAGWAGLALAHPATEQFVPIGYWQSVGVGGTYQGQVAHIAPGAKMMRFVDDGVASSARITDDTHIYLDRSHLGLKSMRGSRTDLRPGRVMEVKVADDGAAIWVKVRAEP